MKLFTNHPHSIGESYIQHMFAAFTFGIKMVFGGLACIIHAIFPFLFVSTGSQTVKKLYAIFLNRTAPASPATSNIKELDRSH